MAWRGGERLMMAQLQLVYMTGTLIPFTIDLLSIQLLDVLHTFKKGHKIMIQIHSTWFPLIDRNPQQWFNNIYTEPENKDFIKATHRVFRSKKYPSHIEIGILSK